MALTPTLLRDLNAVYAVDPAHRRPALRGLILTLRSAAFDAKYLGAKGTPLVAVTQMLRAAEELDEPVWLGLARYCRAQMLGPGSRFRSRELSIAAVDELRPHMADRSVQQLAGMLHLNSALASATLGETERTAEHLREARQLAHRAADRQGAGFAQLSFNPTNVGFWEISLTREQGDAGKAVELAEKLRPEQVKSWPRQAAYFTDLGRALAAQKGRREDAALALVRAEQLSPVSVRANVWVRESVTDLLRRVKRDDMPGRELRGLAYRMGLAA
jgi:tetratricopeptide (TPR) repeat protein